MLIQLMDLADNTSQLQCSLHFRSRISHELLCEKGGAEGGGGRGRKGGQACGVNDGQSALDSPNN